MLKVIDLKKSFKDTEVLKGISFEINSGEIGVVLGKSGAGKTTLIRCICGLEEFDLGEIIVDGISVKNSKDVRNLRGKIGMVFQNFNLFPHLNVLENIVEAPIKVLKQSPDEAKEIAYELLEMVDMLDKKDAYPFALSGGQKQRVAIARSCALFPKVLCFDEPTSALDRENILKVQDIIRRFAKKKLAILIISHDRVFSEEMADKVLYIREGILVDEIEI